MTTGTRKGRVPSVSQVPCWQWLITQYLISWDPITYYAECGTNKLKSTVSRLIDDTPNPAFVCSNVLMLVTTSKARSDNAVCHFDGESPASRLSHQQKHLFFRVCVCVWRTSVWYICVCVCVSTWKYIVEDRAGFVRLLALLKEGLLSSPWGQVGFEQRARGEREQHHVGRTLFITASLYPLYQTCLIR